MSRHPEYVSVDWLPGYRFHRSGTVESQLVRGSRARRLSGEWTVVRPRINRTNGYVYVALSTPDGRKHYRLNVLMLHVFTGERPEGMESAHIDGDRLNNAIHNLEWKTHRENIADKHTHNTMQRGSSIATSVLSESEVKAIRGLQGKRSNRAIARQFNVSETNVRRIIKGETWQHVRV